MPAPTRNPQPRAQHTPEEWEYAEERTHATAGPWEAGRSQSGELGVWARGQHVLLGDSTIPMEEREANARLIAAAPRMRDFVGMVARFTMDTLDDGAMDRLIGMARTLIDEEGI